MRAAAVLAVDELFLFFCCGGKCGAASAEKKGHHNTVSAAAACHACARAAAATAHFLGQLLSTVRSEVATCCEAAYASLAVADAARLLRLDGGGAKGGGQAAAEKELAAIAERRGWKVRGGRVFFPRDGDDEVEEMVEGKNAASSSSASSCAAAVAAPGPELIAQALAYARELERIV